MNNNLQDYRLNLDVGKEYANKLNITNMEENYNNIQDYMNNTYYKVSMVNIDSRNRNTLPANVVDYNMNFLNANSLQTFAGEYRVRINTVSNYNIGDKIVLQNITTEKIILNNPIYLIENYNYYLVRMDNHKIDASYTLDGNYKMNVSLYEAITSDYYLIGNIPMNSIIGIHSIYIYNNNIMPDDVKTLVLNTLNITEEELIKNYFLISLPFNYVNIKQPNSNIVFSPFENIKKIFTFQSNNIGGILLPYLNANYPINTFQYQAYHEITNVSYNYIEFNSPARAVYDDVNGGINVMIGKVVSIIEGYPDANNYSISLKKTFNDVVRLEMISSEIPYIDYNMKQNVTINNNKLYWKYYEDGDYIYSVTIKEGSYYMDTLSEELKKSMNSIERLRATNTDIIFNDFDIMYNNNTQEFKFTAYTSKILSYSLHLEQDLSLGNEIIMLTVKHPNNYVQVGDNVTISNSLDIGDISATLINTVHTVYSVNKEAQTYSIILVSTVASSDINLDGDGGAKTTIKSPALVSMLFNYNDTMGDLLGFKYVGQPTSITPFSHITSNMNDYIIKTPFNSVGGANNTPNYLNFGGQNYYMLLYLNDFENIYNVNSFNNAFTKILMCGNPGDVMFNTYIKSPLDFDIPIKSLSELKIKFLYPDGSLPDFRNLNHSFTLRITERLTRPVRTGLNSMKTNYLDGLKERAFDYAMSEKN